MMKDKIVKAVLVASCAFLGACASTSGAEKSSQAKNVDAIDSAEKDAKYQERLQDKQSMLEGSFAKFLDAVRNNVTGDDMLAYLTDSSEYWLDTLENHAQTYKAEELDTCQFYEVYAILLYRLYEREHLWEVQEDKMLYLLLSKTGMLERFTSLNLGPMKVKNDRGSVGLAKSPEVPVLLFEWDDSDWKLNLPESIPLVTKGIESIAVKKNWTNSKLALYWLEKEYHMTYSRLDESLMEPVGF